MTSEVEAVEALTELALSDYEARCFAALTQLSEGTAKESSQIADVPQSRVYDVTGSLAERGLADVQRSDPKRYFALPVAEAMKSLRKNYARTLETANDTSSDWTAAKPTRPASGRSPTATTSRSASRCTPTTRARRSTSWSPTRNSR